MSTLLNERTRLGWHPITLALALVVAFSLLRAAVAFAWQRLFGGMDFYPTTSFVLFSLATFAVMSVGLIGGGLFGLAGVSWDRLGWRRGGLLKAMGRGTLGLVLIFVFMMVWGIVTVQFIAPMPAGTEAPAFQFTWSRLLVVALWGFFMAAWQEENLYRGYLQPLLIERLGLWPGIIVQAALFSVAHVGWFTAWPPFVSAFVVGLILGWLRGREGSLVAPFIAHGLSWLLG